MYPLPSWLIYFLLIIHYVFLEGEVLFEFLRFALAMWAY